MHIVYRICCIFTPLYKLHLPRDDFVQVETCGRDPCDKITVYHSFAIVGLNIIYYIQYIHID
jgi:hypothetical protein